MKRREFIQSSAAAWVMMQCAGQSALAQNSLDKIKAKKIVWIMLRGATDWLHAVLPLADPYLMKHR